MGTVIRMTDYKKELTQQAEKWIGQLSANSWNASLVSETFRDYSVTVQMEKGSQNGRTVIYYSPKKNQFRPVYQGIREDVVLDELDRLWQNLNQPLTLFTTEKRDGYELYVDGAFLNGKIGFGWVLLNQGMVLKENSGSVDGEFAAMHQIGGEIAGVIDGLEFCRMHQIEPVTIFYDYEGLAAWANRRWKTNRQLTSDYAAYFIDFPAKIKWQKVKGHSGSVWNEAADKLAKKGANDGVVTDINQLLKKRGK